MPEPALHGSTPRASLSSWRPGSRTRSVRVHAWFSMVPGKGSRAGGMACNGRHIAGRAGEWAGLSVGRGGGGPMRRPASADVNGSRSSDADPWRSGGGRRGRACAPAIRDCRDRPAGRLARPSSMRLDATTPPYALLPDCPIDQLKQSRDGAIVLDVAIMAAHSGNGSSSIEIAVR